MENIVQGSIMAFREGLEAFLILVLIIKFIDRTGNKGLKTKAVFGFASTVIFSLIIGYLLTSLGGKFKNMDEIGKLWESIASLLAVGLVTSFIMLMIKHGKNIKKYVEDKSAMNLTGTGIFLISFMLTAREGVEIAVFAFAGQYSALSILIGLVLSLVLAIGIYFSLVRISISTIFQITLIYLIIQAGYLFGYGIHEGLSALKSLGSLDSNSLLLTKAYDLSQTLLDHKEGYLGLPLNILFGWYSKPEWIQLISQYIFTFSLFGYWSRVRRSEATA